MRAAASLCLVALLAAAPIAEAQVVCRPPASEVPECGEAPSEADLAEALEVFERGRELQQQRSSPEQALPLYRRSYELSCRPGPLLNVALALRELGRRVESREVVRALLERHPDLPDELRRVASDALEESEQMIATLTLAPLPEIPSLAVRLDGNRCPVDGPTLELSVDPGSRSLDVTSDAHLPFHWQQSVSARARLAIDVDLAPIGDDSTVAWGVGLGAAGAAVVVLAIALGVFFGSQGPQIDGSIEI